MKIEEAEKIRDEFEKNTNPSEDDLFLFTEAMKFLIDKNKNPDDMMYLGGVYYGMKNFELALKYYEMAATFNYIPAYECLGYIWYYGRTGEKDYKKAFENFSKARDAGDLVAKYKIADMYKNGYYVEKNQKKYEEIIESVYRELEDNIDVGYIYPDLPVPEIYTRFARIRKDEGKIDEAINLYLEAKDTLALRIKDNPFFGNLNIMMWLIDDLYEITQFDKDNFDFFDLYYLLKSPNKIKFMYEEKEYIIESIMEGNECSIKFNNKWFHDRGEFFSKANINNKRLTTIYDDIYGFEVDK